MAEHGWDPNGFDYLVVNGDGRPAVAGRILPMRPNSTIFRWYVFRNAGHSPGSGAEPSHEAARLAVEQAIRIRAVAITPPADTEPALPPPGSPVTT